MRKDCWAAHDLAQKRKRAQLMYTKGSGDNGTEVEHEVGNSMGNVE